MSSTARSTTRPSQDKFDRFEAWLRDNGAQFEMVRAKNYRLHRYLPQMSSSSLVEVFCQHYSLVFLLFDLLLLILRLLFSYPFAAWIERVRHPTSRGGRRGKEGTSRFSECPRWRRVRNERSPCPVAHFTQHCMHDDTAAMFDYRRNGTRDAHWTGDSEKRFRLGCPETYFLDDLFALGSENQWRQIILSSLLWNPASHT